MNPLAAAYRLGATAATAVASEVKSVANGKDPIAEEEVERRLRVCGECEFFLTSQKRCSKCGCFMKFKAKLRSQSCPVGKW